MRGLVLSLFLFGLAGAAFGWWGYFTIEGNRAFDEMSGMIPLLSLMLGFVLMALAFVLAVLRPISRDRRLPY